MKIGMMHTYCCDGGATIIRKTKKMFRRCWGRWCKEGKKTHGSMGSLTFRVYQSKSQQGGQYFPACASSKLPAFVCVGNKQTLQT